nr:uncharacterized protein LOC113400692 [Vanessa tameamea]
MSFLTIIILLSIGVNFGNSLSAVNTNFNLNTGYIKDNRKYTHSALIHAERNTSDAMTTPHNLLDTLMNTVAYLMQIMTHKMSKQIWNVLSTIFALIISIVFGPHINILWPIFTNVAVVFLKLLTS